MSLRRYQPIVRGAQWRDTITVIDPRTEQPINLSASALVLGLYRVEDAPSRFAWGGDYGWPYPMNRTPVLRAQSDGSGSLQIQADGLSAQFFFPGSQTLALCPGDHTLIVAAYLNGQADEILRARVPVVAGAPLPAMV